MDIEISTYFVFWIFFLQRDAFFLLSFIFIAIECIGLNGTLLSMSHV